MIRWNSSRVFAALSLVFVVLALSSEGLAAKKSRSFDMSGKWTINDELTTAAREALPEPKQSSGFLDGLRRSVNLEVGIPGVPVSAPVPGLGNDPDAEDDEADPLHSYGKVVAIEIRDWPESFGVDYGKGRGWMRPPNEKTVETVNNREITTKSGWHSERYVLRKTADDGSKMSEEFELINDGQQLKWTVVERRKGHPEITEVGIYDRVEQSAEN